MKSQIILQVVQSCAQSGWSIRIALVIREYLLVTFSKGRCFRVGSNSVKYCTKQLTAVEREGPRKIFFDQYCTECSPVD